MDPCQITATTVLIAIRITLVGVAVFSLMRNRSVIMEKVNRSIPEPVIDVSTPPAKPNSTKVPAFHQLKRGIMRNTLRDRPRNEPQFMISSAMTKLIHTAMKVTLMTVEFRLGATKLRPIITPATPPNVLQIRARYSTRIRRYRIKKDALVIPKLWIIIEKSLATSGFTFRMSVITGKAIAPPPSLEAPAIKEPKSMVKVRGHPSSN
mmetsp:Transcript_38516/g.96952  ORF Transcript_38516/g.96952 Transcript_38516/m.96952 type:complete len:207 (-) Transcript_38516:143-763(-)